MFVPRPGRVPSRLGMGTLPPHSLDTFSLSVWILGAFGALLLTLPQYKFLATQLHSTLRTHCQKFLATLLNSGQAKASTNFNL